MKKYVLAAAALFAFVAVSAQATTAIQEPQTPPTEQTAPAEAQPKEEAQQAPENAPAETPAEAPEAE